MPSWTKDFLGKGWHFPVAVDRATGKVEISAYDEDIREAIQIILMTKRGERVMRPEFGSRLHEYVYEVLNYTTINSIKNEVIDTLTYWEPRIKDVDVQIEPVTNDNGGFCVHIAYTVRSTNNPYSLVFPFYLTEGMDV